MTGLSQAEKPLPMPLEGITIVEYGVFHAGPGAGAILGDMGAKIIKIESGTGDPERYWTRISDVNLAMDDGESLMFEVSKWSHFPIPGWGKSLCRAIRFPFPGARRRPADRLRPWGSIPTRSCRNWAMGPNRFKA